MQVSSKSSQDPCLSLQKFGDLFQKFNEAGQKSNKTKALRRF